MRNFIITVNGNRYEVGVEEAGAPAVAATPVQAEEPVAKAAAPAPAASAKGTKVLAPFPGLIKNLLLENGAAVKKDQPLLVLEAMKMDNEITAPCDGTVTYAVQKGSNVESDALLATIA